MLPENIFLRDHAIENVWCSPEQDQQFILRPQRVTPNAGVMRSYRLMWHLVPMPDTTSRWHVLQVGGIDPVAFNWFARSFEWVSMLDASNVRQMHVNIYNANGVELPRHETFYRYTQTGTLIIAVRINKQIPVDFAADVWNIRVYSNAYWDSTRSAGVARKIEVHGLSVESAGVKTAFLAQYNARLAETPAPGVLSFYLNGIKRQQLIEGEIVVGDSVEYVWDGSIKAQYSLLIKDLHAFESTLDSQRKLLIHYSGVSTGVIDHFDDVDFHIAGAGTNPKHLYYHRNTPQAVRQLTHRDYSLVSTYVQRFGVELQRFGPMTATENMHVIVTIRHAGYARPLVYEHNHINELYKMSDTLVVQAMVGLDANVPVWRAAALEDSGYTALMRADVNAITPELTQRAYGYFAMSKYLADTPQTVQDPTGVGYVIVPYKLSFGCTAYEYDVNGLFLGWRHHYVGERYYVEHAATRTVELIAGLGGTSLDEHHGTQNFTLTPGRNYRVYQRSSVGGVVQNDAQDITGGTSYAIIAGVFNWTSASITAYPTLRSDYRFYAADHTVMITEGQLRIALQTLQSSANGTGWANMVIPLGQLDVILNGRSLIRGLEYFYYKGVITITAKEYLVLPVTTPQQVHVRMCGFCQPNMDLYPEGDVGYVEHGLLSNNKHFDVRDGKVQRLVMRGKLMRKDQLTFSEESSQVAVSHVNNGSPYLIKDVLVPLSSDTGVDVFAMMSAARVIDKQISDYLTLKVPQPTRGPVNAVTQRYQVFSPFLCKLLFDMQFGRLMLANQASYTRQEVITVCRSYEHLLLVDPISKPELINPAYVVILPHSLPTVINISPAQYQFMTQVIEQYAPGLVSLSSSVSISV